MSNLCPFAVLKYLSGVRCSLDVESIADDATVEEKMQSYCSKRLCTLRSVTVFSIIKTSPVQSTSHHLQ